MAMAVEPDHGRAGLDAHRAVDLFFKGVEALMAGLLVGMLVMVLGNVILRYGFDTGIMASEELSRTFFVWLTFIGAVVAAREGTHLGADHLLRHVPRKVGIGLVVLRELIVIACCVLLFLGSVKQHDVNATTASLVTGMPLIWVFGIIYVMSAGVAVFSLKTLWHLFTGRLTDAEIFGAHGEEAL
jgi:TRAP-type C4-dicarboxylate transport system permease small subunit